MSGPGNVDASPIQAPKSDAHPAGTGTSALSTFFPAGTETSGGKAEPSQYEKGYQSQEHKPSITAEKGALFDFLNEQTKPKDDSEDKKLADLGQGQKPIGT